MKMRMIAFFLIMGACDVFLQAMDSAVKETEDGGLVVYYGKGRRTIGVQTIKSCPVCTKPLVNAHSLVTRLSCNPAHEVHQACLEHIYETGTCPICQKWMPEFDGARFGDSVHKLSVREKALVDLEKDAAEHAPIVQLALELGFPVACLILQQKEQKSQKQSRALEQEKNKVDDMLARLKQKESELTKQLSTLEQGYARECAEFRADKSDFETAKQKLSSLEWQVAASR